MKNLIKYLISGLCLTFASMSAFAEPEQISLGLSIQELDEEEDRPSKGMRIPTKPILCTIDYENHRIELSTSEFITAYELWDEDGMFLLESYTTDSEFVCYLSNLTGAYQLRLVGEDHIYIGYLEL